VNISASNKVNITSGNAIKKRFFPDSGLGDNEGLAKKFGYSTAFTFSDFFLSGFDTYAQKLFNKFIDLTFFRTILEVFTRPIDGTTKIKSFTSIQIEAGKGSTDITNDTEEKKNQPSFPRLVRSVDAISAAVDCRIHNIYTFYRRLFIAIKAFNAISGDGDNAANNNHDTFTYGTIRTDGTNNGKRSYLEREIQWPDRLQYAVIEEGPIEDKVKELTGFDQPNQDDERYKEDGGGLNALYYKEKNTWDTQMEYVKSTRDKDKRDNLKKAQMRLDVLQKANALAAAFANLKFFINKATDDVKTVWLFKSEVNTAVKDTFNELELPAAEDINEEDNLDALEKKFGANLAIAKKKWKRKAVWKLLNELKGSMIMKGYTFTINNYNSGTDVLDDWDNQVKSLDIKYDFLLSWGSHVVNTAANEWKTWAKSSVKDPWASAFSSITQWGTGAKSEILLSNAPNKSYKIENGEIKNAATIKASEKYIGEFKNKLKSLE
jgi:hypothetical protein